MIRDDMLAAVHAIRLEDHFDKSLLAAASNLASRKRLWKGSPQWTSASSEATIEIDADVRDPTLGWCRPKVRLLALACRTRIESSCTCGNAACKHAAALMLRLQKHFEWPRAVDAAERWLAELDEVSPAAQRPLRCRPDRLVFQIRYRRLHGPYGELCARALMVESERWQTHTGARCAANDERVRHLIPIASLPRVATLCLNKAADSSKRDGWYRLQGATGARLLAELLQEETCYLEEPLRILQLGSPLTVEWSWRLLADDSQTLQWALPERHDGSRLFELDGLWCLDVGRAEVAPVNVEPRILTAVRTMPTVSPEKANEWLNRWPPSSSLRAVPPPAAIAPCTSLHLPLQPVIVLGALDSDQSESSVPADPALAPLLFITVRADYGGERIGLAREPQIASLRHGTERSRYRIPRDLAAEAYALDSVQRRGFTSAALALPGWSALLQSRLPADAMLHRSQHRAQHLAGLNRLLQQMVSEGFVVERSIDFPLPIAPAPDRLRLDLQPIADGEWFRLEVDAQLDGTPVRLLPIILAAIRRGELDVLAEGCMHGQTTWPVPLGDGRWMDLPLSVVRPLLAPVADLLDSVRGDVSAPLHVPRVRAIDLVRNGPLQASNVDVTVAADLQAAAGLLQQARQDAIAPVPASFRGTLRDYQLTGLRWLDALRDTALGGVLADDMGLGKTVQVLAHLQWEKECGRLRQPALLVVPKSLVFNWVEEAARFTPDLRVSNLDDAQRIGSTDGLTSGDLLITTYARVVRDIEWLRRGIYSLLLLDEAQWIKNPDSQAAQAIATINAQYRVALTGTPLENHLGELWAQFHAVVPGLLGERRAFARSFRLPIERQGDRNSLGRLRARIAPFLLRRTKDVVAHELPLRTEKVLPIQFNEAQRRLYESVRISQSSAVREAIAAHGVEGSSVLVIAALTKLRLICCDPRLVKDDDDAEAIPSAKLEALGDLLEQLLAEGRHVVVFSQFTRMLALIAERLDQMGAAHAQLTGDTRDRSQPVRQFQQGEVPILLASLKAGGVGLNLTAADTVIHYDPWWNPAVEQQAIDRAHRIGQDKPVFVYRLVCVQTVEDRIGDLKMRKAVLVDALLGDDIGIDARLDEATIGALLAPQAEIGADVRVSSA